MSIETLKLRGVELGTGIPKICVPIVASTKDDILKSAAQIVKEEPDLIELRLDWYEHVYDKDQVRALLRDVRQAIGEIVLLATFRSKAEGGERDITVEQYSLLCETICTSGCVDLLDVEAYMQDGLLTKLCEMAHQNQVLVVASNHDFCNTPSEEEIIRRLEEMDQLGADIPKIAFMPKVERDVLRVLSATVAYRERGGRKPIVTMSMKGLGAITRLTGEIFGSALTFAMVGQSSAPGQLRVEEARSIMMCLHKENVC